MIKKVKVTYPANLPITKAIEQIKELIADNQVVMIQAETGSGKTTQIPKILYDMGFAHNGQIIGHTQPRRIAAKSISRRISEELNDKNLVGYKIRFHDHVGPDCCIKLMTDGILLQEIKTDRYLQKYSALIIDEAHERTLNIDFILGYLNLILPRRKDLKVIITSATMENDKLIHFFTAAKSIAISGETYPVDIIYSPIDENIEPLAQAESYQQLKEEKSKFANESTLNIAIYKAIVDCFTYALGNVLVFLPGEREIKECITFLRKTKLDIYAILPLYSRQNEKEQNLIFENDGKTKIIVTTNVAETSLTIPGIKFVIDSGIAKIKRYNFRYKVEQLQIEKVAQANCKQRAGRAGRISHGKCIRLFSQDDFVTRSEYPDPEILRSNLANVILKLLSLRLGSPLEFPFIDKPADMVFRDGYKTLEQLSALNEAGQLTALGKKLALIPIDVSLARMLLAANKENNDINCMQDVLIIVAFLALNDPRELPIDKLQLVMQRQNMWLNKNSDFLTILNIWQWYLHELKHKKSNKKLAIICDYHFISANRLRQWQELYNQLKETMSNLGYEFLEASEDEADNIESANKLDIREKEDFKTINDTEYYNSYNTAIHQAILTGIIGNVGKKDEIENYYVGARGRKFYIHPTSVLYYNKKNKANWICSTNLVQTKKIYARLNAVVDPQWLVSITKHLVNYNFTNIRWDEKKGEAVATRITLLYGLSIKKEKVAYGLYDILAARKIFIEQALVDGLSNVPFAFYEYNKKILDKIQRLEDKLRITTIIIEEELFAFYDQLLPHDIYSAKQFIKWYEKLTRSETDKFKLDYDSLVNKIDGASYKTTLYPEVVVNKDTEIALKYVFDPQKDNDGVSAVIQLNQLALLDPMPFTWLVPGLIRDKVGYVIKSLPKNIRIKLHPVASCITHFLEIYDATKLAFAEAFVDYMTEYYGVNSDLVTISEINKIEQNLLPPYLRFHFVIMDKKQYLLTSDSLDFAYQKLNILLQTKITTLSQEYTISGLTKWDEALTKLLRKTELEKNKQQFVGYYSLQYDAKEEKIDFLIKDNFTDALKNTQIGLYYLVRAQMDSHIKYFKQKKWPNFKECSFYLADLYIAETLIAQVVEFVLRRVINTGNILQEDDIFKGKEEFDSYVAQCKSEVAVVFAETARLLLTISKLYHEIKIKLKKHALKDAILLQLDDLLFPDFLLYIKWEHLIYYPRYLQAIIIRLEKYDFKPQADKKFAQEIEFIYKKWYDLIEEMEKQGIKVEQQLYDFRYKIEELRVSLFAPHLKTAYPVSTKRLIAQLGQLQEVNCKN